MSEQDKPASKYTMAMQLSTEAMPYAVIEAEDVQALWEKASQWIFLNTESSNDSMIVGLFLNFVNKLPEELRAQFVIGIANGTGMEIEEEDNEVTLTFKQLFTSLPLEGGERKTASGIILT